MECLRSITTGQRNTAIGYQAGFAGGSPLTTGVNCVFIGYNSGYGSSTQRTGAVAIGTEAKVDQDYSIALGGTGAYLCRVGVGVTAPVAALHLVRTTEQLRAAYDASNYLSVTIASTGSATFDLTGTNPIFTFNEPMTLLGVDVLARLNIGILSA
jgi:hypothetical protein